MATRPTVQLERPLGYGGLLLWGSLTLWGSLVFRICRVLSAHATRRDAELGPSDPDPLRTLPRLGRIHIAVAVLVVVALGAGEAYYETHGVLGPAPWITLGASVAFGASVIAFLVSLFRALRGHEAGETARLVAQGAAVTPSLADERAAEWNAHESLLTLVGIVAAVCISSPAYAVFRLAAYPTLADGPGLAASERWALVVLGAGGLFHALGTAFLVRLLGSHFAFERRLLGPGAEGASAASRLVKLEVVMFTDIQGYSRRMEQDEKHALALLDVHNAIVRRAVTAHGGREVKTVGDSFLVLFDSAVSAVECAVALQRGLLAHNRTADEQDRILVRVGIHLGDVVLSNGDVFGDTVNLAARLEGAAEPGGICLSADVFQVVRRKLDLPFVPMGPVALKNIANPPELFALGRTSIEALD